MAKSKNFTEDISQSIEQDENISKQTKLIEFIKSISNGFIPESDIKNKIQEIFDIYSDNSFRHSYSDVSKFLIDLVNEKNDDIEALSIITDNLEKLLEHAKKNKNGNIEKIKKIFKLKDHIDLEIIRHKYISKKYGKEINEIKDKAEKLEENLKDKAEKLENDIGQSKKDLENSKINYVTILGIFSAIMISFTSGLVFSKEVIENTTNNNIYATIMSISTIAIFIGTIIFALFLFIQKINNIKSSWKFNFCVDIFYIFFIYVFIISLNQICNPKSLFDILKFW